MNPKDATIDCVTKSECPYPEGTTKAVIWEAIEQEKSASKNHADWAAAAREQAAEQDAFIEACERTISDLQAALKKLEGE